MARRLCLLLALMLLVLSGNARADAVSEVCQRLIGSEVTRCLAATNGQFVDAGAARQCGRLIGSQVTACMGAIAGKDYGQGESQACGTLIGSQVVDCFRRTGRPHVVAAPPPAVVMSHAEIRTEVAIALRQLKAGQDAAAAARLQRLLDRMP